MSDQPETTENAEGQPQNGENQGPPIVINAQYTKDLSFEAPTTPGVFSLMQQEQPDININVDVKAQPMQNNVFEVALHIKAECTVGETTAFVLELVYGGLFTINVPNEHLQPVLLIECPRLLFPFARNIIADASRDGGFPPLMMGPVDFVAMFQNQVKQAQEAAAAAEAEASA